MNLKPEAIAEINTLLKPLKLPDHKKNVSKSGQNVEWLKKNLLKKNPDCPPRLKELLEIS